MILDSDECSECSEDIGEIELSQSRLAHISADVNLGNLIPDPTPENPIEPDIPLGEMLDPNETVESCVNPACGEWQDDIEQLLRNISEDLETVQRTGDWNHIDKNEVEALSQLSEGALDRVDEQGIEWPNVAKQISWKRIENQIDDFEENFEPAVEYTMGLRNLRGTPNPGTGKLTETANAFHNLTELENQIDPKMAAEDAITNEDEQDEGKDRIGETKGKIDELDGEIGEIKDEIDELDGEIGEIKDEIDELKEEKQGQDEEHKQKLRDRIETRRDRIEKRRNQIDTRRDRIEQHRDQIEEHREQLEALEEESEVEEEQSPERDEKDRPERDRDGEAAGVGIDSGPGEPPAGAAATVDSAEDPTSRSEPRSEATASDPSSQGTRGNRGEGATAQSGASGGGLPDAGAGENAPTASSRSSSPDRGRSGDTEEESLSKGQRWIRNPDAEMPDPDPERFERFVGSPLPEKHRNGDQNEPDREDQRSESRSPSSREEQSSSGSRAQPGDSRTQSDETEQERDDSRSSGLGL